MLTLTRNDLVRMLNRMDEDNADNVKLDICIKNYDCELYIDFDIYNHDRYINTILTLDKYR